MKGADAFVDGASAIARKLKIPAFVIGLTIVAFGTSAPELAVSLTAALRNGNDIAIGNVVGSNIFNTLVVLGASAAITPIIVKKEMIKKDYPLSIFAAILLGILSLDMLFIKGADMQLGRADGIILLLAFGFFMFTTVRAGLKGRSNAGEESSEDVATNVNIGKGVFLLLLGLAGIVIGGDSTVEGAKEIATLLKIDETIIGLTVVAFGTSLPELVTSVIAAKKGESDIAVGNVIGSNIFNIFFILGISATISPMGVTASFVYDIAVLIAVMLLTYIPIAIKKKVSRSTGIIMVVTYIVYTVYLVMRQLNQI